MEKARRLMRQHNVSALYLNGGSTLSYFTGMEWGLSERMFAVILPRQGELIYISPAFEGRRAQERIKLGKDLRLWQEDESPYELVRIALADRGIRSGAVALEPMVRHFVSDGLAAATPGIHWVSGRAITDGCRMIKDEKELAFMRAADQIAKTAFRNAFKSLREGMTEADLGQTISRAFTSLGARGGALVLFGPNSAFPHGSTRQRKLIAGDIVLVDGGCSVQGYQSDVTRTVVFGKPSDKHRQIFQIVHAAQTAAREAARAGVPCEAVDRAARQVIEQAGYGPGYKYFTHRVGHGIGLDGHEEPYLVKGNKLLLQPGMTFSDEPGIYIEGEFGLRLEDIIHITADGCEVLGETEDKLGW